MKLLREFMRAFRIGRGDAKVPPPPVRPKAPAHTIVAGGMSAARLWCMENEVHHNSPTITIAVSGPMLERALMGRDAEATTVVFVYGHGADNRWAAAYNRTEMMRVMGATVVWHES